MKVWWPFRLGQRQEQPTEAAPRSPNPVAIPVPEGADPTWYERVPERKKRGRRRTPEEIEEDRRAFAEKVLERNVARNAFDRQRALSIGVTEFEWRTTGDGAVCEHCRPLNRKRFSYANPPAIGFPGEHDCPGQGYCRCWASPVIPT